MFTQSSASLIRLNREVFLTRCGLPLSLPWTHQVLWDALYLPDFSALKEIAGRASTPRAHRYPSAFTSAAGFPKLAPQ